MIEVRYIEAPADGDLRTAVRIVGALLWLERALWFFVGMVAGAVGVAWLVDATG